MANSKSSEAGQSAWTVEKLYHVAARKHRDSIQSHGLLANLQNPLWRGTAAGSRKEQGVYLFKDLTMAEKWVNFLNVPNRDIPARPGQWDIYEVRTSDDLKPDLMLRDKGSFIASEEIPARNLHLVEI